MTGSVGVHDPELGALAVMHDVHRGPDIDDAVTVRRDLRIHREFELEDIHRLEPRRTGVRGRLSLGVDGEGVERQRRGERESARRGEGNQIRSGDCGHASTPGFGGRDRFRNLPEAGRGKRRTATLRDQLPGRTRYFSNQASMLVTLAINWLGRRPMLWNAPGTRITAVSMPRNLSA